jgi:hypothetical protein
MRLAPAVEIDRLLHPFLIAAAGTPDSPTPLADTTMPSADTGVIDIFKGVAASQTTGVWNNKRYEAAAPLTCSVAGVAGKPVPAWRPSLVLAGAHRGGFPNRPTSARFASPADAARDLDASGDLFPALQLRVDRARELAPSFAMAMSPCSALTSDLEQVAGDRRIPSPIWSALSDTRWRCNRSTGKHDADVELAHVERQFRMRPGAEQRHVAALLETREVGLRRPDEGKARVGQTPHDVDNEILIDPLMQAADVADDRPLERRDVVGWTPRRLARLIERIELHAERKEVHARCKTGRTLTQRF